MTNVTSWGWFDNSFVIPETGNNDISSAYNGTVIDPSSYATAILNDTNSDGEIGDADFDDFSARGETVTVGGVTKTVSEIADFEGSELLAYGNTHYVDVTVVQFTDGSTMVRLWDNDANWPAGVPWQHVDALTLGTFSGTDYDTFYTSTHDNPFICFCRGTRILTEAGLVPVERLQIGDDVETLDNGPRPIRWIGRRCVTALGKMAPVTFARGAIGNSRVLRVSPQHRMLLRGWHAELLLGEAEVLVPAKHLCNGTTITQTPLPQVEYFHLLFDRHEVIFSEGIASESFHPADVALGTLDTMQLEEIHALFPELVSPEQERFLQSSRMCLRKHEAKLLSRFAVNLSLMRCEKAPRVTAGGLFCNVDANPPPPLG